MRAMEMQKRSTGRSRPTRAQTRTRLLQAASDVFAAKGYERASLDDVAAAAGLTKGAIYSSFSSKHELFYALMHDRISQRLGLAEEVVGRQGALSATIQEIGAGLTDLITSQSGWHLLFIDYWARAVRDADLLDEFVQHRRAPAR